MSIADTLGLPPADGEFEADINIRLRDLLQLMAQKELQHLVIPLDPPHASDALHVTITVARPAKSKAITYAIRNILGK